jgi:hypothetical protein
MDWSDLEREFVNVREQLELAAKLAGMATHLHVDYRAMQATGRLDAGSLDNFKYQWSGRLPYKGVYLGTKLEDENPIFGLFHHFDQDKPSETFSTPQHAVKAAVEFHRTHHLSQPRYEIQYTPIDKDEHVVLFRTNSPDEAVEAFCATNPLEGGALVIWDYHEMRTAARVKRTVECDQEEIVDISVIREYLDDALAAITERREKRELARENVAASIKMPL